MSKIERDALQARARDFVNSEAFMRHYEKVHFPAWMWYFAQLIRCVTVIGLPAGIRNLLHFREQAFASSKLIEDYQALAASGRIVRGYIVINSSTLHDSPNACAPALVVASLAGTDEGDAVADDLCGQIVDRIHLEEMTGPADKIVAAMIDDDEYRPFRKRPLPAEFTDGREAHFLDVMLDMELLDSHNLFDPGAIYFLIDPSPRGLILQIPQEGFNVQISRP